MTKEWLEEQIKNCLDASEAYEKQAVKLRDEAKHQFGMAKAYSEMHKKLTEEESSDS